MGVVRRNILITLLSGILGGIILIFMLINTTKNETQGEKIKSFAFAISFYSTLIVIVFVFGCLRTFFLGSEETQEMDESFYFEQTSAPRATKASDEPPSYSEVIETDLPPSYTISMKKAQCLKTTSTAQSSMRKMILTSTLSHSLHPCRDSLNKDEIQASSSGLDWFKQLPPSWLVSGEVPLLSSPPQYLIRRGDCKKLKRFKSSPGP